MERELTIVLLPKYVAIHILDKIKPQGHPGEQEEPRWILESKENFTMRSTSQYIRQKEQINRTFKKNIEKRTNFQNNIFYVEDVKEYCSYV